MTGNRIIALEGILLASLSALAQGQSMSLSQFLAPCIDEQTFAVIRVNLAKVDVDALFDTAAQTAAKYVDADQLTVLKDKSGGPRQAMKRRIAEFKAAGGETIYFIASTNDLPLFLMAIPATTATNADGLKNWLDAVLERKIGAGNLKQTRKQNFLLFGVQQTLERSEKTAPVTLPLLDKAAGTAQDATFQVLLVPNRDSKLVLGAMLPALAEQGIQIDGNAITNGLQWATLAIDLPPKSGIRLHIQAADVDSAAALGKIVAGLLQRVGQIRSLRQVAPSLDASLAQLTPTPEGNVSHLALDDKQCIRLGADFIAPAVVELRKEAARLTCGANLSGLGKAMLIYANDYNDKFPPNLDILVKTVEMTPQGLRCGGKAGKPDAGVPYTYRGVDLGGTNANPDLITVYCREDHCGGRNVLFLDSHVDWVTEERFKKLIERDNLLRRQAGLPEKPAE